MKFKIYVFVKSAYVMSNNVFKKKESKFSRESKSVSVHENQSRLYIHEKHAYKSILSYISLNFYLTDKIGTQLDFCKSYCEVSSK